MQLDFLRYSFILKYTFMPVIKWRSKVKFHKMGKRRTLLNKTHSFIACPSLMMTSCFLNVVSWLQLKLTHGRHYYTRYLMLHNLFQVENCNCHSGVLYCYMLYVIFHILVIINRLYGWNWVWKSIWYVACICI